MTHQKFTLGNLSGVVHWSVSLSVCTRGCTLSSNLQANFSQRIDWRQQEQSMQPCEFPSGIFAWTTRATTSHFPSLIALQERQKDKQKLENGVCRNHEVASCKPLQHGNWPARCQHHHWTSHRLPALWASHTCGYYVRSYGPTRVFLEVMGSLDSIQRIKESFERTLLFGWLYPVWTLNGDDPTIRGLRPQWN